MDHLSREHLELSYGTQSVRLPTLLPSSYTILKPPSPEAILNSKDYINAALDAPQHSKPFNDIFKKGNNVLIIHSDITRYSASELYLPIIIDRLNQQGINDKNITIIFSLGIHRKQTAEEHKCWWGLTFTRELKFSTMMHLIEIA